VTGPRILRPHGSGRFVFFCDHATNYIPAELYDLGLPASELVRHIAWEHRRSGRHRSAIGNLRRAGKHTEDDISWLGARHSKRTRMSIRLKLIPGRSN